jgi:hypothetical protein
MIGSHLVFSFRDNGSVLSSSAIAATFANYAHLQADLIGPMGNGQYKYALVLTDVQSRYVTALELTAPTAKNVVDKLLICSYFGLPRYISFDCGTHFTNQLSKLVWNVLEFLHDFIVLIIHEQQG